MLRVTVLQNLGLVRTTRLPCYYPRADSGTPALSILLLCIIGDKPPLKESTDTSVSEETTESAMLRPISPGSSRAEEARLIFEPALMLTLTMDSHFFSVSRP